MKAYEMKKSGSFVLRACAALAALGFAFTASADIPASAYEILEYASTPGGTGSPRINTEVVPATTMEFRFKYAMDENNGYRGVFGSYAADDTQVTRIICANGHQKNVLVTFLSAPSGGGNTTMTMATGVGEVIEGYLNLTNAKLNAVSATLKRNVGKECTVPMHVFAAGPTSAGAKSRFWYFSILDGGSYTHHYLPCRRTADGVVGLWDAVAKSFVEPTGGALTASAAVHPGYRFGANDVCQFGIVATAKDGGTVSVNDGEAGASASIWSNVLSSDNASLSSLTATVTATANEGWRFVRWEGDVDGLTAAEKFSPRLTVTTDKPLLLTAVFVFPFDLPTGAYVQDGLIAQWDGIDNAGTGTHDLAATTWTDLTGHGYDATPNANVVWAGDHWENESDGQPMTTVSTLGGNFLGGNLTVEFCAKPSRLSSRATFVGQYNGSNGLNIEHVNSSGQIRVWNSGSPDYSSPVTLLANEIGTVSVVSSPTNVFVYKNGALGDSISGKYTGKPKDRGFILGGEPYRADRGMRGSFYACRFYNRRLTPDEIAFNAMLDKIRYENVDPATLTWPDGYHVNAESGKVECRIKVSCGVSGDGSVTIDGEDIGEGFDQWCEIGTGHVLTAIPGNGQEFHHWEGDVEGLSLDEKMRPTLAISGNRPCDLSYRAVFRRAGSSVHLIPTDFATLAEALASDQVMYRDVIRFIEGVHCDTTARTDQTVDSIALKVFANVDKPVVVEGMGTDKTVLDLGGDGTLLIDNPEAILRNLVITNFQNMTATASTPLFLNQGTATNVVITGAQPSSGYKDNNYIAVVEKDARMCGCDVRDITNTDWVNSAIIRVKGGTLCHSKVRRCASNSPKVLMSVKDSVWPRMEDCELTDNLKGSVLGSDITTATAFFIARNTLIARNSSSKVVSVDRGFNLDGCRILDNVITSGAEPIVYFGGYGVAYMTNCLVAGNQTYTGPIFRTRENNANYICNCTVAHNRQLYGETATFNVVTGTSTSNPTRVFLTNTIFFDNPDSLGNERTFGFPAEDGKFLKSISHCLYPEAAADDPDGNVAGDPRFVDAAAGDFMLSKGSPCIDAGVDLAGMTDDLEGRERPLDGDGDGVVVTDIGCYEKPVPTEAIEIALDVTVDADCVPGRATLKATVTGLRVTDLAFEYLAVRTLGGEVTTNAVESSESTYTFTGLGVGLWSFACRVRNGAFPPDEAVDETKVSVAVKPATTYVSLAGGDEWPYDTEAKAARNLQDAVEASGRAVKVLAGTYSDFTHFTDEATGRECLCAVHDAISVEGAGVGATVVDCGGMGGILLGHSDARIYGVTFTNFMAAAGSGPALYVEAGSASNVVVNGGTTLTELGTCVYFGEFAVGDEINIFGLNHAKSGGAPLLQLYGATLRNSRFENCKVANTDYAAQTLPAGRGTRSRIEYCQFVGNTAKIAGALYAMNTDIYRSNFEGNSNANKNNESYAAAVRFGQASMTACTVVGNSGQDALGFDQIWSSAYAGAITNCLIANNTSGARSALDVTSPNTKVDIVNCTIVNNKSLSNSLGTAKSGGIGWLKPGTAPRITVVNTIIWGNTVDGEVKDLPADMDTKITISISHCCFSEADDWATGVSNNIAKDPRLYLGRRLGMLRAGSPCIDAGDNLGWTADDIDLAGAPRIYNKVIDMGCYEKGPTPGLLIFAK